MRCRDRAMRDTLFGERSRERERRGDWRETRLSKGGGTYSTAPLDLPCNAPSVDGDDDDDESDEIIIRDEKGMEDRDMEKGGMLEREEGNGAEIRWNTIEIRD